SPYTTLCRSWRLCDPDTTPVARRHRHPRSPRSPTPSREGPMTTASTAEVAAGPPTAPPRAAAPARVATAPQAPGDVLDRAGRAKLILLIGSLIAVAPLTIDMYLPALPVITTNLATTSAAVQLTLTGTLVGLAAGQLLVGPVSDAVGRRRPLLAGLALHVVASVLCALAPNIAVLGILRVLQGFGVAAALVVAIAVVRDLFSGNAFASVMSRLMLVMGVAPILAPTLGGALLNWTDWRGVFVALAVAGTLLAVVAATALRETLPVARRRPARVGPTLRYYGTLLRDRTFMGLVVVTGLVMGAVFANVAGSPFVLQGQFGLTEQQFAVAFGAGALGLITATQVNVRLLRRYPPHLIAATALVAAAIAALVLVGFAATGAGGLAGVLVPLFLVLAAAGLVQPNAPAVAMSRHGEAAGTAGAVLGAVQFGVAALAAPVVGVLGSGAPAMATVIAGTILPATVIMLLIARRLRRARRPAGAPSGPALAP